MARCKMLVKGLAWALTLGVAVAQLESLDACALGCVSGLRDRANTFGCEIGALECICTSPEFAGSARDCASQSCGQVDQINNFSATFCAAQAAPTSAPAPEPTQADPAPTSTVERPTPEQAPQSTATESSSSEPTPTPTETTSTTAPAATTSSATTSSAAGGGNPEQSNGDSDDDEKDKKEEEEEDSSKGGASGLSLAAKAGIGVSIGVVGVSAILVAILLFLRRRSRNGRRLNSSYTISGPMPGSGRDYADSHSDFGKEHNGSELEMTSRRYEDMLPRAQPASVI